MIGSHDRAHHGNALSTCSTNRGDCLNIDATDRKPGHGGMKTGFRHPAQAGWSAITFGSGGEDGANAQIIGALFLGLGVGIFFLTRPASTSKKSKKQK